MMSSQNDPNPDLGFCGPAFQNQGVSNKRSHALRHWLNESVWVRRTILRFSKYIEISQTEWRILSESIHLGPKEMLGLQVVFLVVLLKKIFLNIPTLIRFLAGGNGEKRRFTLQDLPTLLADAGEEGYTFSYLYHISHKEVDKLAKAFAHAKPGQTVFVTLDPELHPFMTKHSWTTHLVRDYPKIDKSLEIELFTKSHAFLDSLDQRLAQAMFRETPIQGTLRAHLSGKHILFKRLAVIIQDLHQQGFHHIILLSRFNNEFQVGSVRLAERMGIPREACRILECTGKHLILNDDWQILPRDEENQDGNRFPCPAREETPNSPIADEMRETAGRFSRSKHQLKSLLGPTTCSKLNLVLQNVVAKKKAIVDWIYEKHNNFNKKVYTKRQNLEIKRREQRLQISEKIFKNNASIQCHYPAIMVTQAMPGTIYWKVVIRLLQVARERGTPILVVTTRPNTCQALRNLGDQVFLLSETPPENLDDRITVAMEEYMHLLARVIAETESPPLFPPLLPHEKAFLSTLYHSKFIRDQLASNMFIIDFLLRIFNDIKPKSVFVFPQASGLSHPTLTAARLGSIPSVSLPAVTIAPHRRSLSDWDVDFIASYGDQCHETFVRMGYPADMLVAVGNVSLDSLINMDATPCRQAFAERFHLDFSKRIILVATSRIDSREDLWLRPLVDLCQKRGDCQVVVKVHPSYGKADYARVGEPDNSPWFRIIEGVEIYAILKNADLCITDYSTVGMEAVICALPVVVVNLLGKRYPSNNYDEYGVALAITTLPQVEEVITRILDDPSTRETLHQARDAFLQQYNYFNDGQAGGRLLDLLLQPPPCTRKPDPPGSP